MSLKINVTIEGEVDSEHFEAFAKGMAELARFGLCNNLDARIANWKQSVEKGKADIENAQRMIDALREDPA